MPRHKDTERREAAFQLYKKFGCNLRRVSREEDMPSTSTLVRWKQEGKWDARVDKNRDDLREFSDILQNARGLPALENDLHQLKVLEVLEDVVARKVRDDNIIPESWRDVLDTLKFVSHERRLLMGKPTSRPQIVGEQDEDKEAAAFLQEAQRIIRNYSRPVHPPSNEKIVTHVGDSSPDQESS